MTNVTNFKYYYEIHIITSASSVIANTSKIMWEVKILSCTLSSCNNYLELLHMHMIYLASNVTIDPILYGVLSHTKLFYNLCNSQLSLQSCFVWQNISKYLIHLISCTNSIWILNNKQVLVLFTARYIFVKNLRKK